ncbi:MAG: hypothetical protein ACRETQ_02655 [Gammaproteobacteria bacterium]
MRVEPLVTMELRNLDPDALCPDMSNDVWPVRGLETYRGLTDRGK